MKEKSFANEKAYNKSPLVEVACQFLFGKNINILPFEQLSKLRNAFESDFPILDENLIAEIKPIPSEYDFQESRRVRRVFRNYANEDKTRLVQFGDLLFSINFLKHYSSWADFKPTVLDSFKKYWSILPDATVTGFKLIYINHFNLPESTLNLADYFMLYPFAPPEIETIGKFSMNISVPCGGDDKLLIEMEDISDKNPLISVELSYIKAFSNERMRDDLSFEELIDSLDRAHAVIGSTFEQIITNKTRVLLGVQTDE